MIMLRGKNYHYFQREPGVTYALDIEEGYVSISLRFVQHPWHTTIGGTHRQVFYHRNTHVRMSFKAKWQNGYTNEEYGHNTNYL